VKLYQVGGGLIAFYALSHHHPHSKARWIRQKAPCVTVTTRAEAQVSLGAVKIAAADSLASQECQPQAAVLDLRELLRRKQFGNQC
jgi:hypothetical protein